MTPLTIAIQAGGKSSRMGTDKSFVPFLGRPMIEVVLERVAGLGDELIIVTNKPDDYAYLGLPIFGDDYPDTGPLGGIYTAVNHARYERTLVVACDMPWLNRPLLAYMVGLREAADVVVPRWDKFEKLEAGVLKITAFYGRVSLRFVEREEIARFDPEGRSFVNVNTPDDLAAQQQR